MTIDVLLEAYNFSVLDPPNMHKVCLEKFARQLIGAGVDTDDDDGISVLVEFLWLRHIIIPFTA